MTTNIETTFKTLVCFIVCDSGPAGHFAAFSKSLYQDNGPYHIEIHASGPALAKLQDSNLPDGIKVVSFQLNRLASTEEEEKLAKELNNKCHQQNARLIITDIGNKFDIKLQEFSSAITNNSWTYYDNPEVFVPGGYSLIAHETIKKSKNVLFANMNLAKANGLPDIDLTNKTLYGVGYYPTEQAEMIYRRRITEKTTHRAQFFAKHKLNELQYHQIFVYFGGNNQVYFEHAFPAFLSFLRDAIQQNETTFLFLIQQHPAAKQENLDGKMVTKLMQDNNIKCSVLLSDLTSDQAQILADGAMYYQTSMGPQFALAGIPVMQVGHDIYDDVLVRNRLSYTATDSHEFIAGLRKMQQQNTNDDNDKLNEQKQLIYQAIGYNPNWSKNLEELIKR
ncbi:unnamed protein product [Didymodactylos carnosus]|uniref:Capsule polysaccharide biosynthesis protein n=1 Tax=Didymodactylos carnosus TaxID=1234261 RepID=A0A813VM58_9BILA|nr:unnamed protein product [Didymodactylos carnosus]CAF1531603.1 unnamed protein product [Didymodactylos carnosus]CAF3626856.1 unnamed protein product [Didymodactylos carnosus]CAF4318686.1 unnamed protein product [Didymodactylos carnosus]